MRPIGRRRWAIAEGYIPEGSTGDSRQAALALLTTVAYAED